MVSRGLEPATSSLVWNQTQCRHHSAGPRSSSTSAPALIVTAQPRAAAGTNSWSPAVTSTRSVPSPAATYPLPCTMYRMRKSSSSGNTMVPDDANESRSIAKHAVRPAPTSSVRVPTSSELTSRDGTTQSLRASSAVVVVKSKHSNMRSKPSPRWQSSSATAKPEGVVRSTRMVRSVGSSTSMR